ncbi:MAG TPA: NADH-quinone oxidoreductase subunit J [Jatrophihabitans sp.]|jgi:NADH-quinone oxidoreductase subunit J|uniref:NADH-quinone oxidoreductase subunit J n=1 Tax=Jatrophihabitans sp. TaxID=1932789 RepID=UPI002E07680D|nr:NADH-quinone oxidoreductase subunit J [Jatrophihabitans sp.]
MSAITAAGPLMNGQVPLGEAIAFWVLGPISLAGAIGMVLLRNAVHSALSLVATMMSLGAFYVIQQGPFLGLVQIIVYTGAIMILFLFVLMLIGRDSSDSIVESLRGQRWAAALFGIGFALMVALAVGRAFTGRRPVNLDAPNANGQNVHSIAQLLFTKYLFAFELTSALLIVAAVGAMVLAHIEREGRKPTQKVLARERIRSGRPQPLPGPGVLSTGNSIGTPALLPDGSISHESVMAGVQDFPPYEGKPGALPTGDYSDSEVRS